MNDNALDVNNTNVAYQPGLDEPCVFTGNHRRRVSAHWLTWYIRNNPRTSLAEVHKRGEEVIEILYKAPPKVYDPNVEPVKFTDNHFPNSVVKVPRLEWILWYATLNNVSYWWAYQTAIHGEEAFGKRNKQNDITVFIPNGGDGE